MKQKICLENNPRDEASITYGQESCKQAMSQNLVSSNLWGTKKIQLEVCILLTAVETFTRRVL